MGYLDSYYISENKGQPFVKVVGKFDELEKLIEDQNYIRWVKLNNTLSADSIRFIVNEKYPDSIISFGVTYPMSYVQWLILEEEHRLEYEEFLTKEEEEEMNNIAGLEDIDIDAYPSALFKSMKGVINQYFDDQERIRVLNHASLLGDLSHIYVDRNRKYGNSFSQNFLDFGMMYPVSRIGEKYNRLKGAIKNDDVYSDESLEDTLLDIANYSLLTIMELRNQEGESK